MHGNAWIGVIASGSLGGLMVRTLAPEWHKWGLRRLSCYDGLIYLQHSTDTGAVTRIMDMLHATWLINLSCVSVFVNISAI